MGSPAFSLLISLTFAFAFALETKGAGIAAMYRGPNAKEGSLAETCGTGNYDLVILVLLSKFIRGHTPMINLAGHCDPSVNGCSHLSDEIKTCQKQGVKVLLSRGGGSDLATYIRYNFLAGNSSSRPLGDAVLDGVDFDVEGCTNYDWDVLEDVRWW